MTCATDMPDLHVLLFVVHICALCCCYGACFAAGVLGMIYWSKILVIVPSSVDICGTTVIVT